MALKGKAKVINKEGNTVILSDGGNKQYILSGKEPSLYKCMLCSHEFTALPGIVRCDASGCGSVYTKWLKHIEIPDSTSVILAPDKERFQNNSAKKQTKRKVVQQ